MEPTIKIYRGYTYAAVSVLQDSPVARYVGDFVRERLVENEWIPEHNEFIGGFWRKVRGHYQQKCMYAKYNKKTQKLHIPISYADELIRELQVMNIAVAEDKISDYPLREVDVQMKPEFHDQEHQVELIKKCSEKIPGMKGLAMQTGKGKTYSAIKSWCNLGYAGIVIVYGLVDQWIKSILEFTDVNRDYVYKIQEFKSLELLSQNPDYRPKFFAASYTTMQLFLEGKNGYELLPWNFSEFFRFYGVGVKIIDETHRCFHGITCMDLTTNVPYNLYCSATFTQSGKDSKRIFNRIFPMQIRYGLSNYDRYVHTFMYGFYGSVSSSKCVRSRGYSHTKYEHFLLKSSKIFESHISNVLHPLIMSHYINHRECGDRLLITCASIEYVTKLTDYLSKEHSDLKVISYLGGDKISALDGVDIIVSTASKSGTGLDIKNLTCVINTISMKSETLVPQLFGRLRKIPNKSTVYVDMWDNNVEAQVRHAEERKSILKQISKTYQEYGSITDLAPTVNLTP